MNANISNNLSLCHISSSADLEALGTTCKAIRSVRKNQSEVLQYEWNSKAETTQDVNSRIAFISMMFKHGSLHGRVPFDQIRPEYSMSWR